MSAWRVLDASSAGVGWWTSAGVVLDERPPTSPPRRARPQVLAACEVVKDLEDEDRRKNKAKTAQAAMQRDLLSQLARNKERREAERRQKQSWMEAARAEATKAAAAEATRASPPPRSARTPASKGGRRPSGDVPVDWRVPSGADLRRCAR